MPGNVLNTLRLLKNGFLRTVLSNRRLLLFSTGGNWGPRKMSKLLKKEARGRDVLGAPGVGGRGKFRVHKT